MKPVSVKKIIILLCQAAVISTAYSQNVGINISNPTRAKLEVVGTTGGGATSGMMGSDGAGISIQQNWPTIGFNQYRDDVSPGSQGKYMANGYAAIQYFDPASGNMVIDMFASGIKGNSTPPSTLGIIITSNGRVGIRSGVADATLTVGRGDGSDGTAAFRGRDLPSHFNYSVNEDTYIRSGTAAGNVFFNNIPSGDVVMGTGLCRLGINTGGVQPTATVEIRQPTITQAFSIANSFGHT